MEKKELVYLNIKKNYQESVYEQNCLDQQSRFSSYPITLVQWEILDSMQHCVLLRKIGRDVNISVDFEV